MLRYDRKCTGRGPLSRPPLSPFAFGPQMRRLLSLGITSIAAVLISVADGRSATIFSGIGLGDEESVPDGRASGMGGAGIALLDGENFVRLNPAVLASFRRPAVSALFRAEQRRVKDRLGQNDLANGDMGYVRVVLANPKGIALRLALESVTGASFSFAQPEAGSVEPDTLKLEIEGGLQAVSFGIGLRLMENHLYLGADLEAILMGTIKETWTRTFVDASLFPSQDQISRKHRGYRWTGGLAYKLDNGVSLGAFITPRTGLSGTRFHETIFGGTGESRLKANLPTSFGWGLAYQDASKKWVAAADLRFSLWGKVDAARYRNARGLGLGIGYVTGSDDRLNASLRIPLRAGFSRRVLQYNGLPGGNRAVTETSAGFGVGVPFKDNWGRFEVSFEAGKRGNVQENGARELFFKQTFSIVGWAR